MTTFTIHTVVQKDGVYVPFPMPVMYEITEDAIIVSLIYHRDVHGDILNMMGSINQQIIHFAYRQKGLTLHKVSHEVDWIGKEMVEVIITGEIL